MLRLVTVVGGCIYLLVLAILMTETLHNHTTYTSLSKHQNLSFRLQTSNNTNKVNNNITENNITDSNITKVDITHSSGNLLTRNNNKQLFMKYNLVNDSDTMPNNNMGASLLQTSEKEYFTEFLSDCLSWEVANNENTGSRLCPCISSHLGKILLSLLICQCCIP